MSFKLTYQYQMVLSLANREVEIKKIAEEIKVSVREFNIRSKSARNSKEIVKWEIREDENLLYIWLKSNNEMGSPIRGLFLLSKLIMEQLGSEDKEEEKKKLLKDIIRNKCFFKIVEEPKEVKNLKLELEKSSEEIEELEESQILINDIPEKVQEINISIIEADKVIRDLFYNTEIRGNAEEKAIEEILRAVENYLIAKGVK